MTATRRHDGGVAVLFALVISFLSFGLLALVIDMGLLRTDRRDMQTVSDLSAVAGVMALWDSPFAASPLAGCDAAWDYFLLNTPDAPATPSPCAGVFPATIAACDPALPYEVTGTAGNYTVTIMWPVPDADPAMQGRYDLDVDGHACERFAVNIGERRDLLFAPAGIDPSATEGTTGAPAVARSTLGSAFNQAVSLVVLDRTGCQAIYNKGQGKVWVREAPNGGPGIITVDSDGSAPSCSIGSERFVIAVDNNQHAQIKAGVTAAGEADGTGSVGHGIIFSYAMHVGATNAYDPDDALNGLRLAPTPVRAPERITRAPIDHRYNCKASYPAAMDIEGCEDAGTRPAYIDQLRAAYGGTGRPNATFVQYTHYMSTFHTGMYNDVCTPAPTEPPLTLPGQLPVDPVTLLPNPLDPLTGSPLVKDVNWWIDCPPGNNGSPGFNVKNSFTIQGGDVVVDGGITVASGASFSSNVGAGTDRVLFVRASYVEKNAQASFVIPRTMMYVHNGYITFGAGSPPLTWTAPIAGDFEDLALWSESSAEHLLGGQATLNIEGAFFTPNAAPFNFDGQGDQQQTKAQFITHRLLVTGQGKLIMTPDPERSVLIPIFKVSLIR